MGYGTATTAGAAAVVLLAVPVLAVGGIIRGVNNSKVNHQIETLSTLLPFELQENEEKTLHIFFPLAPSPRHIELTYTDPLGEHALIVDTQTALDGLHLVKVEK
jgi:hypothetical protein